MFTATTQPDAKYFEVSVTLAGRLCRNGNVEFNEREDPEIVGGKHILANRNAVITRIDIAIRIACLRLLPIFVGG